MHVSGHLSLLYLLILLSNTDPSAREMVLFNQPEWLILARIRVIPSFPFFLISVIPVNQW
jgi:hypothetical protein